MNTIIIDDYPDLDYINLIYKDGRIHVMNGGLLKKQFNIQATTIEDLYPFPLEKCNVSMVNSELTNHYIQKYGETSLFDLIKSCDELIKILMAECYDGK